MGGRTRYGFKCNVVGVPAHSDTYINRDSPKARRRGALLFPKITNSMEKKKDLM